MALKFKLDSLDGLNDEQKKQYKKVGNKYVLDLEDGPEEGDLAGLKLNNETLLGEKKALAKKLADIEAAQAEKDEKTRKEIEEAARKAGNVEALEKSWQEKLSKREKELLDKYEADVGSLNGDVTRLLVENVAQGLASKIAVKGSDITLLPHIKNRLRVDVRDGKRTTVVVDAKGQPSALTLEDLEKEFVGNAAFAPVIAGSNASGGGAGGGKPGGAGGAKTIKRSDFEALDPVQRAQTMKDKTQVID